MRTHIFPLLLCAALSAQAPVVPGQAGTPETPGKTFKTLDQGLLQNAWFGADVEWKEHSKGFLDFFWVQPGLNLKGHTLQLKKWEKPSLLASGRSNYDTTKAIQLEDLIRGVLEARLEHLLNDQTKVSFYEGDLLLEGRIVDCKCFTCDPHNSPEHVYWVPVGGGRMVPSSGGHVEPSHLVFDLKLTDVKTGQLLVALHHQIGKTTRDLDTLLHEWVPDFGRYLGKIAVH